MTRPRRSSRREFLQGIGAAGMGALIPTLEKEAEASDTPVKLPCTVAVVPTVIGTFSSTLTRTRTKLGSCGHSSILVTCPAGTPA